MKTNMKNQREGRESEKNRPVIYPTDLSPRNLQNVVAWKETLR
jgi:hypothetical protein